MGSRGGVRAPTPPAVDPSIMGPMLRATTQRHPPDQLINAIRAALLSTIRAECAAATGRLSALLMRAWLLPLVIVTGR